MLHLLCYFSFSTYALYFCKIVMHIEVVMYIVMQSDTLI